MLIEPDSKQELHFIAFSTPSLTAGHAASSQPQLMTATSVEFPFEPHANPR
jgi:hypothetical protein